MFSVCKTKHFIPLLISFPSFHNDSAILTWHGNSRGCDNKSHMHSLLHSISINQCARDLSDRGGSQAPELRLAPTASNSELWTSRLSAHSARMTWRSSTTSGPGFKRPKPQPVARYTLSPLPTDRRRDSTWQRDVHIGSTFPLPVTRRPNYSGFHFQNKIKHVNFNNNTIILLILFLLSIY